MPPERLDTSLGILHFDIDLRPGFERHLIKISPGQLTYNCEKQNYTKWNLSLILVKNPLILSGFIP